MNELALFAGAGGGILGGKLLGWRTLCGVEIEPGARAKLAARQNDGCLEAFPIWDDVRTFDGSRWRGRVDIVSGGFPCQDISVAGKGDGLDGARSGLWREFARIIGEVRPRHVFIENSPALVARGGVRVVGDLAALGYDCRWGIISAADAIWLAGPPCFDHLRERIWIAGTRADANCGRRWANTAGWNDKDRETTGCNQGDGELRTIFGAFRQSAESADHDLSGRTLQNLPIRPPRQDEAPAFALGPCPGSGYADSKGADADGSGCGEQRSPEPDGEEYQAAERRGWWAAEPDVGRMAHGVADRVDRLHCLGNGQVPAVVRLAWETLKP